MLELEDQRMLVLEGHVIQALVEGQTVPQYAAYAENDSPQGHIEMIPAK